MSARLKPWLSIALLGLINGVVWEALGNIFLWTLASPQLLVYLLALITWFFLGLAMAVYLCLIVRFLPRAMFFLKPLAGGQQLSSQQRSPGHWD